MSARDTILLALTRYYQGNSDPRGTAMQVVDGYDSARRTELLTDRADVRDRMLRNAHAAGRAEALAEFATWLVKKSREGFPDAAVLASKVSRGAVRPDNLRMLPPDFFEPDHAYTHRDGSDFHCVAITTHPQTGQRLAMGWRSEHGEWHRAAVCNLGQWLHEYDGVQAPEAPVPQHFDKTPDPLDGCHWCACGNRWPCEHAKAVTA